MTETPPHNNHHTGWHKPPSHKDDTGQHTPVETNRPEIKDIPAPSSEATSPATEMPSELSATPTSVVSPPPERIPSFRPDLVAKKKRKKAFGNLTLSFLISIILIGAAGLVAGSIVVWQYVKPTEVMFKPPKKQPKLPARELQHKIRVKKFQKQTRKPKIMSKLVSKGESKLALPELPPMKFDKNDVRSAQSMLPPMSGTSIGELGIGTMGLGDGSDSAFEGFSQAEFFGTMIKTRSVVIIVDKSKSLLIEGLLPIVTNEALQMVENFHPDTAFNMIFYVDHVNCFSDKPVFATQSKKASLAKWLTTIGTGQNQSSEIWGSTPYYALQKALEMKPDTIIMIADDDSPWRAEERDKRDAAQTKEGERAHMKEIEDMLRADRNARKQEGIEMVTINVFAYKPKENSYSKPALDFLKSIAKSSGGRFKKVFPE